MSDEQSMIDRVARAIEGVPVMAGTYSMSGEDAVALARAAIEAMKDPSLDILGAMFEAMFEDKWNASQAPMIGSGWDAGIDAALNENANAR